MVGGIAAASPIQSGMVGIASRNSITRWMALSTCAAIVAGDAAEQDAEDEAERDADESDGIEIRVPWMMRLSMSRPSRSAPHRIHRLPRLDGTNQVTRSREQAPQVVGRSLDEEARRGS